MRCWGSTAAKSAAKPTPAGEPSERCPEPNCAAKTDEWRDQVTKYVTLSQRCLTPTLRKHVGANHRQVDHYECGERPKGEGSMRLTEVSPPNPVGPKSPRVRLSLGCSLMVMNVARFFGEKLCVGFRRCACRRARFRALAGQLFQQQAWLLDYLKAIPRLQFAQPAGCLGRGRGLASPLRWCKRRMLHSR